MKRYEVNFYMGEQLVRMVAEPGLPIQTYGGHELNEQEIAFLFVMAEGFRCLANGKEISFHFNPYDTSEDECTIMKLQWRAGNLRVLQDSGADKWQHAHTVQEALDRKRNFTCSRALYRRLPRRRKG